MADVYKTLAEKPVLTHYLYVDTVVEQPVETVWKYIVDFPGWLSAHHRWESFSGTPGTADHLWRIWPHEDYVGQDVAPPHYHLVGTPKFIPNKFIAAEVWMERGGSYGGEMIPEDHFGLDNLLLADLGGTTLVTALYIETSRTKLVGERSEEDSVANIQNHFENLKKLIAANV